MIFVNMPVSDADFNDLARRRPRHYCDECEAELDGSELAYDGTPALVTDGDHYWCRSCWDERRADAPEDP